MAIDNFTHIEAEPERQDIVITRIFDAPMNLVFEAYVDPTLIPRWWGPKRFTTTVDEMDPRPGGSWKFIQRDSEGNSYSFHGIYHTVDPPNRIVQTSEFGGAPGHVSLETLRLEKFNGKTRITSTAVFQSVGDRDAMADSGMEEGVLEMMDRLQELLDEMKVGPKGEPHVVAVTHTFDAPLERVWMYWTTPEYVRRWWGPKGFTAPVIKIELKVGGKYLYCMRSPTGEDYWSTGIYRQIEPLSKISATDSFSDKDGNIVPATQYGMSPHYPLETHITVTFNDEGEKTRLTINHLGIPAGRESVNVRQGWIESLEKLEESLRQPQSS